MSRRDGVKSNYNKTYQYTVVGTPRWNPEINPRKPEWTHNRYEQDGIQ